VDIQYLTNNRINRARDTNDGFVWRNYTHDARGNVSDNDRLGFTYDRAEQPTAISGAATGTFTYDGNLKRVKQVLGGETVYSVYGLSGAVLYRDNATTGVATDYIRAGGMTIARIKGSATSYLHADHLGSPVAATTTGGSVQWREDYTPYGEERQDPAANDNDESFTGHIKDDATGLTYMQARYFDPVIGRFLSGDPVGFSPAQPQMFNRYSYTFNDPVNATDPSGKCPWCVIGAVISGGLQLAREVKNGNIDLSDGIQASDLAAGGRVALAAGTGALGVGVGARILTTVAAAGGSRLVAGAVGGAVGSAIADGGTQTAQIMAGEQTIGGAIESIADSTVMGAVGGGFLAKVTPTGISQVDQMITAAAVYVETVAGIVEEAQAAEIEPIEQE